MEKLKKQIKFYFSLPNLACDNFLLTKLLYEKSIKIDLLLKFNKISKILTKFQDPLETLTEACSEIPDLKLEGSKIFLTNPVSQSMIDNYRESATNRTIYFENIPDSSNHTTIKSLFRVFGKILYISLPRYPESQILKGFGFVEFSNAESCDSAIAILNNQIPAELKNFEKFVDFTQKMWVMNKAKWLEYKERFQILHKRLRVDSPQREFKVRVEGLPIGLTETKFLEFFQIKPWKIEFKNSEALLFFANELDKKAVLRCQPYLYGKMVRFYDI